MQPTVSIDRQQLAAFERTIAKTIEQGKKSVSGAMIQAAVFASQSAAGSVYGQTNSGRFRKFGKKNRVSRRHSRRAFGKKTRSKYQPPWWSIGSVDIWAKGRMTTHHFRTESTFQKARPVPRRGLAGNVWRAAGAVKAAGIAGVFMRSLTQDTSSRLVNAYSENKTAKTGGMISRITMSNSLNYIQKVAPNSAREGIAVAERKLDGILRKNIARDIEKAFQRRQVV